MKKRVGVIGAAGLTGGEVLRILLRHPQVDVAFAHSRSQAGKPWYAAHPDLVGETDRSFDATIAESGVDAYLLCLGHGESARFLAEHPLPAAAVVVDLSQDHRPRGGAFVYGLPELQRDAIRNARRIANPGCFATAIQLALLPAFAAGAVREDVQVSATTGSTGAGQALSATTHFSWRYGNHSPYKTLEHQHLLEIGETLLQLDPAYAGTVHFIPQRGAFTRGISAVVHAPTAWSAAQAVEAYSAWYAGHPFTHVAPGPVDLKQVVNTNKCLLHVDVKAGRLLVTAVTDNLLKGASGQAVQNMNLALGLDETAGLLLKPVAH
ncbi:MAG: N-acetyl-gamma-glutamyl-phosphate reductase [Flavobacteriales bacterium]